MRATYERLLLGSQGRCEGAGALIVAVKDGSAAIHLERLSERVRRAVRTAGGGDLERVEFELIDRQ
jgi:hypothetical protein